MNKRSAKNLFKKISESIPENLFKQEESKNEAAIDIYLTAMGCRPACIPFDGEVRYGGEASNTMIKYLESHPEVLNKLSKIKEITIEFGPYYDAGNQFVIFNTNQEKKVRKLFKQIISSKKIDDKHIPIGKMLGYTCPINLVEIYDKPKYSIYFKIDEREHMFVWCPVERKYINKALDQLEDIKNALDLIDKKVELVVSQID